MTEKLTYEAIEEMVEKAKAQTSRLIDSMFRQVVADFEMANSEGFKLALTIEGERRGQDATLTLQTKAQSAVDVKRKDQTQAEIVDWGPNLFTQAEGADIPTDDDEEERGPKLLCSASPVFDAAARNGEVVVEEGETGDSPVEDTPAEEAPAEDDKTEDDQTEDDNDGDAAPEDDAAEDEPNN